MCGRGHCSVGVIRPVWGRFRLFGEEEKLRHVAPPTWISCGMFRTTVGKSVEILGGPSENRFRRRTWARQSTLVDGRFELFCIWANLYERSLSACVCVVSHLP